MATCIRPKGSPSGVRTKQCTGRECTGRSRIHSYLNVGLSLTLYPVKGAWRPFEFGLRNCIGQGLALLELKLVMVMTLRDFSITASYDVCDQDQHRKGARSLNGERAYQVLKGTTRPADGFPCRVAIATRSRPQSQMAFNNHRRQPSISI